MKGLGRAGTGERQVDREIGKKQENAVRKERNKRVKRGAKSPEKEKRGKRGKRQERKEVARETKTRRQRREEETRNQAVPDGHISRVHMWHSWWW